MRRLPKTLAARYKDWKIAFIVPCIDESDENVSSEDTNWGKRKEKRIVTVGFEIILEKDNENNPPLSGGDFSTQNPKF